MDLDRTTPPLGGPKEILVGIQCTSEIDSRQPTRIQILSGLRGDELENSFAELRQRFWRFSSMEVGVCCLPRLFVKVVFVHDLTRVHD